MELRMGQQTYVLKGIALKSRMSTIVKYCVFCVSSVTQVASL